MQTIARVALYIFVLGGVNRVLDFPLPVPSPSPWEAADGRGTFPSLGPSAGRRDRDPIPVPPGRLPASSRRSLSTLAPTFLRALSPPPPSPAPPPRSRPERWQPRLPGAGKRRGGEGSDTKGGAAGGGDEGLAWEGGGARRWRWRGAGMDAEYPAFEPPLCSELKHLCKRLQEAYRELKEDLTPFKDDRYYR